jgi:hypothetical protein
MICQLKSGGVLVAFPFFIYFNETQRAIEETSTRVAGVKPLAAMFKLLQVSQSRRGNASLFLKGDKDAEEALLKNDKAIDEATGILDSIIKREIDDPVLKDKWASTLQKWITVKQQVITRQYDEKQSYKEHSELYDQYFDLLESIADHYDMAGERGAPAYLLQAILDGMSSVNDSLAELRGQGRLLLVAKQAAPTDRVKQAENIKVAQVALEGHLLKPIYRAFVLLPEVKEKLDPLVAEVINKHSAALAITQKEIVDGPQVLTFPYADYRAAYLATAKSLGALAEQALVLDGEIMEKRVDDLTSQQLTISFTIIVLFLIGAWFGFYISLGITGPVGHLVDVMDKLVPHHF